MCNNVATKKKNVTDVNRYREVKGRKGDPDKGIR